MKNLEVVLAAAGAVVVGWAFAASADIPASAYVQDGLVAQFDGIENAKDADGHIVHSDADGSKWLDLVSGESVMLYASAASTPTIGANHYAFAGKGDYFVTTLGGFTDQIAVTGGFTVEMASEYSSLNTIGIAARIGGEGLYYQGGYLTYTHLTGQCGNWQSIGANVFNSASVTYTSDAAASGVKSYLNGALNEGNTKVTYSSAYKPGNELKVGNHSTSHSAVGKIYSARFYNRKLDENEVWLNAMIDRVRFEGADLPEGMKYENGAFWVKLSTSRLSGCGTVTVNGSAVDQFSDEWVEFGAARTLVATPGAGQAFVRWDGEGLTDAERANATLSLACTRSWDLVAVFQPTGALPTENHLNARSYVTDGLIHQWDGRENVGYAQAQDKAAKTWVDLASGQLNIPVPTKDAVFTDDGLQVSRDTTSGTGASGWTTSKAWGAFTNRTFTVEAAYNQTAAMSGGNPAGYPEVGAFLGLGDEPYWFGVNLNNRVGMNGCVKGTSNGSLSHYQLVETTLGQHTLSCSQDDATEKIGFDGAYVTVSVSAERNTPKTGRGFTFAKAGYWTPKNTIDGVFYSMRFYDHPLSDGDRQVNLAVDKIRFFGGDASTLPLTGGYVFDYSDGVRLMGRCSFSVQPAGAGLVSIDDGEPSGIHWYWSEKGGYVTKKLVATPADGYVFAGWKADFRNADDKLQASVTAEIMGDVVAVFRKSDGSEPYTYTWVGGNDADWNDRHTWHDQEGTIGLPAAYDNIVLPAGKTVALTNATPEYGDVTIAGTVAMSNWDTCLRGRDITVSGLVKPSATFTPDTMSNRVYIACRSFTLTKDGKINADKLGYKTGPSNSDKTRGYGPGQGAPNGGGGGHGGRGGMGWSAANLDSISWGCTYGSLEEPVLAGSSGGSGAGGDAPGGGAVRIAATGPVRLWGPVVANGGNGGGSLGGGSGGSIYVSCATFDGTNVISACGGFNNVTSRGMGGGGRISIRWTDAAAQALLAPTPIIRVSSRMWGLSSYVLDDVNRGKQSLIAQRGDAGTIYLTDESFYPGTCWSNVYGNVFIESPSGAAYQLGDVALEGEAAQNWSKPGQEICVANRDVVLGRITELGQYAHLVFSNCNVTAESIAFSDGHLHLLGNSKLTVNGDVTVGGAGQLTVQAGETNGVDAATWNEYGAYVEVKGRLTLNDTARLNVWSHDVNGGSPFFKLKNVTVAEGAKIYGNTLGWGRMSANTTLWPIYSRGYGPGASVQGAAASYGGKGGRGSVGTIGAVYGDRTEPTDPGSSAGKHSGADYVGGYGGGLFRAVISGKLTLDGAITMNGGMSAGAQGGGGSGGGVNIRCKHLAGAGSITAIGGDGKANNYSGDGGGGRIAIRIFGRDSFTGTISATNGCCGYAYTIVAQPGTVYYKVSGGLKIILR